MIICCINYIVSTASCIVYGCTNKDVAVLRCVHGDCEGGDKESFKELT